MLFRSSDPIYDASNPSAGGFRQISALIYDSLGNSSNLSINYTKESSNSWGMSVAVPKGAANIVLTGNYDKTDGGQSDVYYAAGQLEFNKIPSNGSTISITDQSTGKIYNYEFNDDPSKVAAGNIYVDNKTGVVSPSDFVQNFVNVLQSTMPSGDRFSASSNSIQIVQSTAGSALTIDASKTLACVQSSANPNLTTGIPTGIFSIPEIEDRKSVV